MNRGMPDHLNAADMARVGKSPKSPNRDASAFCFIAVSGSLSVVIWRVAFAKAHLYA
jgi:hypothetical protein